MHEELADIKGRLRRIEWQNRVILGLLNLIHARTSKADQKVIDDMAEKVKEQNDELTAALAANPPAD